MSDTDDNVTPEDRRKLTAAEYVLGVLGVAERREVEQRLTRDRALANEVAFWEERLGVFAETVAPVAPPAETWARIEQAVSAPAAPAPRRESLWHSLAFWRPFAIGSAALAAASIGALTYVELVPPRAPLLAKLDSAGGQANFVAAVLPDGGVMVVPAALLSGDQRAMELWLIPPGDRPHSLGLIEPGRPVRLNVPRDLRARVTSDAVLAVSLEPPGGSPTGQPTGPVIANGKLTSL
jgi:anti-sigma-K factor RskA